MTLLVAIQWFYKYKHLKNQQQNPEKKMIALQHIHWVRPEHQPSQAACQLKQNRKPVDARQEE
jgi:hypothetical protein